MVWWLSFYILWSFKEENKNIYECETVKIFYIFYCFKLSQIKFQEIKLKKTFFIMKNHYNL